MTVFNIDWSWGSNQYLSFDPHADQLNFAWMGREQFTIEEKNGSVVISIPSNQQTYVLDGVSLSTLSAKNIIAKDASAMTSWTNVLQNGPDSVVIEKAVPPATTVAKVVDPMPVSAGQPVLPHADVVSIDWNWGAQQHIAFHPATDKLDFGWFQSSQFQVREVNGSVVIDIPATQQAYILDGIKLSELSGKNIVAKDSSVTSAWAKTLGGGGAGDAVSDITPPLPVVVEPVPGHSGSSPVVSPQVPNANSAAAPDNGAATMKNDLIYSPYVDLTMVGSAAALLKQVGDAGLKNITLAFMQSDGKGGISWGGGDTPMSSAAFWDGSTFKSAIQSLAEKGCGITISVGGAAGTDPATVAGLTAAQLQRQYQSIIDTYGVTALDFDVEGAASADANANRLRNQALVNLEAANPHLKVSFTLAVLPTGLTQSSVDMLKDAANAGLVLNMLNIMAMDYGSAVDNNGQMGVSAIQAIKSTETQLDQVGYSNVRIGVTPMIGVNDVNSEIFTLADAQKLVDYAKTDLRVAELSAWSLGRDNGTAAGQQWASPTGSGLAQKDYQFSQIFETAQRQH